MWSLFEETAKQIAKYFLSGLDPYPLAVHTPSGTHPCLRGTSLSFLEKEIRKFQTQPIDGALWQKLPHLLVEVGTSKYNLAPQERPPLHGIYIPKKNPVWDTGVGLV